MSVYSSYKRTYSAACSLAPHVKTNCFTGRGNLRESLAVFGVILLIPNIGLCMVSISSILVSSCEIFYIGICFLAVG